MNQEKMGIAIFVLLTFIFMKRILQWSRLGLPTEGRKTALKINLICVAIYSAILLLPALFYHPTPMADDLLPGPSNVFMIVLWFFILIVHLFFFWIAAEIGMATEKSERRKNHIQ